MGEALIYEYLMRAAYNTDRHGAGGDVDADIYRHMEHAIRELKLQKEAIEKRTVPVSPKSLQELEYQVRSATAKVRMNVERAISVALRDTKLKYAPEETRKNLEVLQSRLTIHEYEVKVLEEVVCSTWAIFRENGLDI